MYKGKYYFELTVYEFLLFEYMLSKFFEEANVKDLLFQLIILEIVTVKMFHSN